MTFILPILCDWSQKVQDGFVHQLKAGQQGLLFLPNSLKTSIQPSSDSQFGYFFLNYVLKFLAGKQFL